MTQREKILAAAVAAMVLLWGGNRMWTRYNNSIAAKRMQLSAAKERLIQARTALDRGEEAVNHREAWQQRSLPADREAAQSLYRVWLETQFKAAGLTVEEFQPAQRLTPAVGYSAVGYTVSAHGPLKSLANFLHEYYRSRLLQQITRLQLRPDANPAQLRISLQTEALILPGTANENLPEGVAERSAKPKAADYAESIGARNLFAVYRPPGAQPTPGVAGAAPPKPEFDDAKHAYFTATIQVDGRYQAWIHVRTTNETLRLFAGDEVKVGLFDGRVVSIESRAIVVKSGDEELRIKLGDNLRDGKAAAKTADI
jgi:hypothetical protein